MGFASQSVKPSERVLIIGLDGATWANLAPLVERGELPTFKRLMSEGVWGDLLSTIPALTPPAWASLITGTNPGKHGVYHFRHTPPGDYYQRRLTTSRDIQSPTLWQRLNQHGKRVGIINVPLSYPVYPVDGFMTSDAFAPDTTQVTTHPPELASEFSSYIVDVVNYPTALPGTNQYVRQMLAFVDENERVLISQADTAVRLMKSQPWQFFMVAWMATDRLGHFAWRYSDPSLESSLKTAEEKQIGTRVKSVFRQIDTQMGRLVEAAGENCSMAIVSDHGFGPVPGNFFHTNQWLIQRGYLALLSVWHWQRALMGYLPRSWKGRLGPFDSKFGLVDWSRTRVWADPLEARAVAVRVNRAGRYPQGNVPDSEVAPLLERLIADFSEIKTPSGEKIVAEVHRGEALYHGTAAVTGPDLVVILDKPFDVPPSFRRDVRSSELIVPNLHVLRDGGHEPEGIFLVHGPNIRATGKLAAQSICAIAPTVLQAFGLPIGDDIDAEPIREAFTDEFLRAFPPRRESKPPRPRAASPTAQPEYSEEDTAVVEERLRKLGYLD